MGLQPRGLGGITEKTGNSRIWALSGTPPSNQPLTSRFPHLQSCVLCAGGVDSINLELVIVLTGHGLHLLFELRN